ncbi:DUF1877 family protein [Methylocystis parvus]|uniref:DUF1877 family protein n=1 Tax=Methylocystis parvus TaxID=134 RepID=A0A6B8M408_9HYPH|nr:DUF1877 family protein [Methylocystis parvus]QGM97136.1 DUF1877 family protein [Methylocystis parvus]WBJ98960.1 YfbM family protein [Methylocystis parvus OBBP]
MSMTLYLKHASQNDLARYAAEGVESDDLGVLAEAGVADRQAARLKELELLYVADEGRAPLSIAARDMLFDHLDLLRRRGSGLMRVSSPSAPVFDLHGSWRMLHFLFTGDAFEGAPPAATLLAGGREVGEDLGFGPPRMLSLDETAAFSGFLNGLDLDALAARLDGKAVKSLGLRRGEGEACAGALHEDLARYFPGLQAFVAAAASRRQGMLIWML